MTTAASIPTVLAAPPWVPARKRPKLALPELEPRPTRIVWANEEEQKVWIGPPPGAHGQPDRYATMSGEERDLAILGTIGSRGILPIDAGGYLSLAGIKRALEMADHLFVEHYRLARIALAKYGLDVLDDIIALVDRAPREAMECFRHIDSPLVAEKLATKYAPFAEEWYALFPRTAARKLLPVALTGPVKESVPALRVLRGLMDKGHAEDVLAEARELGEGAVAELEALLAPPPLPPKPPALPSFVDLGSLPVPRLSSSGESLTPEHVERLVQLLACLPLGAARAAILTVKDACDPASLGDLCRALIDRWASADAPSKEKWVLTAAGLLGDDLVTHRLAENIEGWAEEGKHPRVASGVAALGEVGSDIALLCLTRFAEKSKVKNLKKKAAAVLDAYREEHGVSADELGDRIVPDLGLDARGELTLSYGPRSFRAVFDENLKLTLRDGDKPLRSLPRAADGDDPRLVDRAQVTWDTLKKESKSVLEAQVRRLERAMARARTWSWEQFERYHLHHPLMQHFARRLVWGAFDGAGALVLSFRIAEDGTFANASDDPVDVPPVLRIGIVHPLVLGRADLGRWGDVLGDYQIVQPFPQLARETFLLDAAERDGTVLRRFSGVAIEGGRFYALKHRGWEFFDYDIGKRLSADRSVTLDTSPGLEFLASKPADQTLGEIRLHGAASFGSLAPIEASELIRDVEMLRR